MKVPMRPILWFALILAAYFLADATAVVMVSALTLAALVMHYTVAIDHLRDQAGTDALTGLANYRRLMESLRTEIARSGRADRHFSVVFVDMDGLKGINDQFGHLAGSLALRRLAEALRQSCRTADTPGRFGGDEFAVILPETDRRGALSLAARLTRRLDADERHPRITITTGIAEFPRDGATPAVLLGAADRDLYERKVRPATGRSGRRRGGEPRHAPAARSPMIEQQAVLEFADFPRGLHASIETRDAGAELGLGSSAFCGTLGPGPASATWVEGAGGPPASARLG